MKATVKQKTNLCLAPTWHMNILHDIRGPGALLNHVPAGLFNAKVSADRWVTQAGGDEESLPQTAMPQRVSFHGITVTLLQKGHIGSVWLLKLVWAGKVEGPSPQEDQTPLQFH